MCGCKYVKWINPEEFIRLAEEQDAKLAADAEKALNDARAKAEAALKKARKGKAKRKDAKRARKRKK